jgi:hypothetical protein
MAFDFRPLPMKQSRATSDFNLIHNVQFLVHVVKCSAVLENMSAAAAMALIELGVSISLIRKKILSIIESRAWKTFRA